MSFNYEILTKYFFPNLLTEKSLDSFLFFFNNINFLFLSLFQVSVFILNIESTKTWNLSQRVFFFIHYELEDSFIMRIFVCLFRIGLYKWFANSSDPGNDTYKEKLVWKESRLFRLCSSIIKVKMFLLSGTMKVKKIHYLVNTRYSFWYHTITVKLFQRCVGEVMSFETM